ncbi:MAG TPA: hypothetical protein VGM82_18885 [Gemmatimonadaceae bacterium]
MYFPAYEQLATDLGNRGATTWRVYMHLLPPRLDFVTPREVKVWALAIELQLGTEAVSRALNWLVDRGYLIAHERSALGVRSFRLAHAIAVEKQTAPQ